MLTALEKDLRLLVAETDFQNAEQILFLDYYRSLISCVSKNIVKKTTGESFTMNEGFFLDSVSGKPKEVQLGELSLEPNCDYEVEVYVRTFAKTNGETAWQLARPKLGSEVKLC